MAALDSPLEQPPILPDMLAGVGNHEAKALLMIHLGTLGLRETQNITAQQLHRGFRDFIGEEAPWYPNATLPIGFALRGFVPAGYMTKSHIRGVRGPVDTVSLTDEGFDVGLPSAGLLSDWSLNHPELSVQHTFGPSISAVKTRVHTLNELLKNPDRPISISHISGLPDSSYRTVEYKQAITNIDSAVTTLGRHGLAHVERASQANLRRFRIVDVHPPRADAGEVTHAIHRALQTWVAAGVSEFTTEACVEAVVADLRERGDTRDEAIIRGSIISKLGSSTTGEEGGSSYRLLPGLERADEPDIGQYTRVSLNPTYRGAIAALLEIVQGIGAQNPDLLERGHEAAERIARDTAAKHTLMGKAFRFSANTHSQPVAETSRQIVGLLTNHGAPMDSQSIRQQLLDVHDYDISTASVQRLLRSLVEEGSVTVTPMRTRKSSRVERNFYSLPGETNS